MLEFVDLSVCLQFGSHSQPSPSALLTNSISPLPVSVPIFLPVRPPPLLCLSLGTVVFTLHLVLLQWRMETWLAGAVSAGLLWE